MATNRTIQQTSIRASETYQKVKRAITADEYIQTLMNNDRRRAGEEMLKLSVLLEIAGRQYQEIARLEKVELEKQRKEKQEQTVNAKTRRVS